MVVVAADFLRYRISETLSMKFANLDMICSNNIRKRAEYSSRQ